MLPGPRPPDEHPPAAIVALPDGREIDGRRLLAEAVGFGRALRAGGLSVDLVAAIDFSRALTLVQIGDREQVRAAGEAIFVRRRDDRAPYDRIFARWWRQRTARLPSDGPALPAPEDPALEAGEDGADLAAMSEAMKARRWARRWPRRVRTATRTLHPTRPSSRRTPSRSPRPCATATSTA